MIVTKQNLQDRKIEFNVDRFIKSRLTTEIYFKYFYDEPPIKTEFNFSFVQMPKVLRVFS